jgi:hypothetical protein
LYPLKDEMKQQTINKYAHLEYETLHKLDITIPEYWFLDMVYQLSRDGSKNNNRITIDNKGIENRGKGYKLALRQAQLLKKMALK